MSVVARDFIGGPLDGQMFAVGETAVSMTVPHPEARYAKKKIFCKYGLFGEDMMFIDTGSRQFLVEKTLGTNHKTT